MQFQKLDQVESRFRRLEEMLANPDVISNAKEYAKTSREHAELAPLVEAYQRYKKVLEDLDGTKAMLNESDPELRELAKAELPEVTARKEQIEGELQLLLLPKDPNDGKNIVLEIRAGTGGDEASIFAGDLFRMYERYAQIKGWRIEPMSMSAGTAGGFKEIIAVVSGPDAYSGLKFEGGVHRVQRVPATEAQGRIHTSTATVATMPEAEDVDIQIPEKDLRIDVFRSSGHGGQSVNTTDSAVRVVHLPTGITVSMQDEKSQHKNKDKALRILKARLYDRELERKNAELRAQRLSMVGSGDRSERIRTYNFPQGRMTDHRAGLTRYDLAQLMEGRMDDFLTQLRAYFQAESLKEQEQGGYEG